jgi:hypothetical protein
VEQVDVATPTRVQRLKTGTRGASLHSLEKKRKEKKRKKLAVLYDFSHTFSAQPVYKPSLFTCEASES